MKPRIALFGLPPNLTIRVYAVTEGGVADILIYSLNNTQSDHILEYVTEDVEIGCTLRISIMCSGICPYEQRLQFVGSDISHVPNLRKETNTREADVVYRIICRTQDGYRLGFLAVPASRLSPSALTTSLFKRAKEPFATSKHR